MAPRRDTWAWAPARRLLDALIAASPLVVVLASPRLGTPETSLAAGLTELLACGALVTVALVLRRRHPVIAVLVCAVVSTAAMLLLGAPTALVLSVFIALGTLAASRPLRTAAALWVVCTAMYVAGELATGGWDQRVLAPLALMAASTAIGVAVRQQRSALHSARERAEIAERNAEQEAARRVAEERLRIARELHDVVAHHVAVMGVQAGVAGHLMDSDPAQARHAITAVRAAGRTAITELGALVGLLRSEDDDVVGAPVPGLAQLPALVATMRQSGLQITTSAGAGTPSEDLDEMSDITGYRIVQESLTNALRHGTGSVELDVQHTSDAVLIRVSNPVAAQRTAPTRPSSADAGSGASAGGHGLVGMRERATLVGADVSAGPTPDGRFEVRARLPRRTP